MLELRAQPIVTLGAASGPPRYELLAAEPGVDDARVVGRALDILASTRDVILHVDLSAASVADADTMDFLEAIVRSARLAPGRLVFELTETARLEDLDAIRARFERLHTLGCRLALDDFGSGLASVVHLKQLPFDFVKVDGAFVRDVGANAVDRATVQAITGIARGLGMTTVAAQVSSAAAVDVLRDLGVEHGQGSHLGDPKPLAEYLI